MTDKEQIIIDGVDIFNTIDEWADLISQEWCSGEYPTAEIIKNYILDINKQLARKTQKYNELLEQHKELDDRANRLIEEKYNLSRECEELKNNLHIANTNHEAAEQECDRYLEALEEIKDICIKDVHTFADGTELRYDSLDEILDIINKAKGEE